MNKSSTSPISPPDDLDEAPPITQAQMDRATYRIGLKPMPVKKQKISITLDPDIIAWFKEKAGERGYQTLINATLRDAIQQRHLEEGLRQIIREEISRAALM
ncbi:MAG: BrnA antitoxin family protein [Candidatus Competibacter denitrificans]